MGDLVAIWEGKHCANDEISNTNQSFTQSARNVSATIKQYIKIARTAEMWMVSWNFGELSVAGDQVKHRWACLPT